MFMFNSSCMVFQVYSVIYVCVSMTMGLGNQFFIDFFIDNCMRIVLSNHIIKDQQALGGGCGQ